ncbi:MAG: hypothetical protein PHS60_11120 [Zavarzinia sp.]|nr:hypothetical protein [Zavarzinia sp.]
MTDGEFSRAKTAAPLVHPVTGQAEEWTHEECVEYEVARETLGGLIGYRSAWIDVEGAKPIPDRAAIARWEAETDNLVAELRGLDVRDRANVARILRDYGGELRRLNGRPESPGYQTGPAPAVFDLDGPATSYRID